ncbi:MAG: Rpn family recombination-promoting nuclease/putative transposase [Pseudanabaena sp.]|jgi:predicted transposase/invertase (TIGR01784 family)|nr:Rpn family recombination-promoting nuclease/putative transposase [Pseudanabaena sp. M090S1SP2A07QC]MCA6505151.1 Rpn family recombination-promoting nuclease/putative transposase [Pseudanabaena sp. M172S2SP2A07QC]MCA6518140.1 Rpn family recombination-promoting nuclease/putative transposase [Pseudanabaena sp. M110S1SP2A07QC]MCA6522239.1 Rpn family recombination-promoting nuclease/putative transposase [Pseudanabaena sp. M051S1SP2A07QC]MCA6527658.1 Rpn family recombination-promoting nuclease/puta
MIDNICKFLAETFPIDFASWLLGEPINFTKLEPSELSVEPIRADSVIFLKSLRMILHIEFQTDPNKNIPFRMTDYLLRLHRQFPDREIYQVVIYLTPSESPLVYETTFNLGGLSHQFNVIRLWEQPTEIFQQYQGLLPFATLSQTKNPEETLRQVARQIEQITDKQVQSNVAASTAIISGIALNKEIIQRLLRSEIMKESVIYQEILREGIAEGEAKGLAKGKAEGIAEGEAKGKTKERNQIAINMMHSNISVELIAQFTGLTLKEVQKLQKISAQKSNPQKSAKTKRSPKS